MMPVAAATHRLREVPAARAVLAGGVAAALVVVLSVSGCSVDPPETPQFETQVFLPLGVRTSTGLDLIDDEGYIEGDSVGAAPLRFVLRGAVDSVEVGSLLDLSLPATRFSFGLDGVHLISAQPLRASILLPSLCDQFGTVPRETLNVSIAPFIIPSVIRAVSPPENITWVHLERGRVRLTLENYLPVPLAGAAGAPLRVRLRDHLTGMTLSTGEFATRIAPGATAVTEARLDGAELSRDLDLELSGSSPGSSGGLVDVHADDQVVLDASFSELVADSAYAVVPAQSVTTGGTVDIAEDMEISEGVIGEGMVRFVVENPYPVEGTARATLPSVHRATDPEVALSTSLDLPAARVGVPGRAEATLDLAGAVVSPATGSGRSLEYRLDIETRRSGGPVRLGIRASAHGTMDQGRLSFDAVLGRLDGRRFELSPTETSLDPPAGIDSLGFTSASLALEITSTIAFPSEAELTVIAEPGAGGAPVSVPLWFSVGAAVGGAPRTTRVTFDETNPRILELLTARPRKMRVSGGLRVGRGEDGTIRRTDRVWGEYMLSAPLRVRIGRITHRTDPAPFTVSRDNQDLIRENVIEASARGTVTSHFPAGLEVRLVFAGREADLALDPATHQDRVLALDPVVVAPGETDSITGRVVRSRVTPLAVTLRRDQVSFFIRDQLYSQAVLIVSGESAERAVEVTALDFVEVTAMLNFRVRVKQ
jgi:hypothetical protein